LKDLEIEWEAKLKKEFLQKKSKIVLCLNFQKQISTDPGSYSFSMHYFNEAGSFGFF